MPQKIGFAALAFFVFSMFSSVVDLLPGINSIRPSLLDSVVGLLIVVGSGRMVEMLRSSLYRTYILLTLWFGVCVPFSVWPGGAAATITGFWLVTFLAMFLAGGLIWNVDQCRKLVNVIGYSATILSVIALYFNKLDDEGRLMLPNTHYGNSNELALIGLVSLPFLTFMTMRVGNGLRRILGAVGFAPILLMIAKTGSRAAMIGSGVALIAVFFNVRAAQKAKLLVFSVVAVAALLVVLPSSITGRFFTVFSDSEAASASVDRTAAIESAQARRMLLLDSITLSFTHPIFGVGPGNFAVAQDTLARARGEEIGNWHLTHNTYTQFSSESGFPGLLLFLTALVFSFRSISRTMKMPFPPDNLEAQDLKGVALALRISMIGFLSCAFFDSLAYSPSLTVMLGFSASIEYVARRLAAQVVIPVATSRGPQMIRPVPKRPMQPMIGRQLPGRA